MTTPRRKRRQVGGTLGGFIVGFDQQIFRTLPPPHELILKARPVRGLSGHDGGELVVTFPDDSEPPSETAPSGSSPAEASPAVPAPSEPEPDPKPKP